MVRSQDQPPTKKAGAKEKEGPGAVAGSWELVECEYKHIIGYPWWQATGKDLFAKPMLMNNLPEQFYFDPESWEAATAKHP